MFDLILSFILFVQLTGSFFFNLVYFCTLFFFFLDNEGVWASLRAPRLIPRVP